MLHIDQMKFMQISKERNNIDLTILNNLNLIIDYCIMHEDWRCNQRDLSLLLKVSRVVMDKLTNIFPSQKYDRDAILLYIALRRYYRRIEQKTHFLNLVKQIGMIYGKTV